MEEVELEEILPIGEVPQNAKDDSIYEEYFIDVQRCFYPMVRSYRAVNPSVSLKEAANVMTNEYLESVKEKSGDDPSERKALMVLIGCTAIKNIGNMDN
tara:strand:- start:1185 stop:1481 length:297 start_codon:yes stop_codon:yes gene_type:complete